VPVDAYDEAHPAGLYAWLVEREEREYQGSLDSVQNRGGAEYPRRRILAALRAGEPVTVRRSEVPARFGLSGPPLSRTDHEYWRRQLDAVVVLPDDRVELNESGGGAPLAEYRDL